MTQFNKIIESVCFQCLQLQSVLIFLTSTYLVIRTHFSVGGLTGQNSIPFTLGGENQNGSEQSRPTAWERGEGWGIWSKCADCMTWYIQVKMSDNCNTGVVRLLYLYYVHIPWKRNSIYNSVHLKHGGWQLQELLHLLTVTVCCWQTVNKAVSPCDLSIIFVQLLLEHPVQVIHKTVDGKTTWNLKYILYTVCRQWTGGDVMKCFVTVEDKWEGWRWTLATLKIISDFTSIFTLLHHSYP